MKTEPVDPEVLVTPVVALHSTTPTYDARWLVWKALQYPGNILEIGCHHGEMTREFAMLYPTRHVWTVDWVENNTMPEFQRPELLPSDKVNEHARYMPNVNLLLVNSRELDYDQLPGLSFVYIDGDHGYEGVKADSEKVLAYFAKSPKAARPACVVWHDYCTTGWTEGVGKYLDSRTDLNLVRVEGSTIVYLEIE